MGGPLIQSTPGVLVGDNASSRSVSSASAASIPMARSSLKRCSSVSNLLTGVAGFSGEGGASTGGGGVKLRICSTWAGASPAGACFIEELSGDFSGTVVGMHGGGAWDV